MTGLWTAVSTFCGDAARWLVRDTLFFPPVEDKFTREELDESRAYLASHPVGPPCTAETREISVTVDGINVVAKVAVITVGENNHSLPLHYCLRVGGNDESVDVAPMRCHPYVQGFCDANLNRRLLIVQPSIHNLTVDGQPWRPSSMQQFADIVFAVMPQIAGGKHVADSMLLSSMGSIALTGLNRRADSAVPKDIICERTCPSVWKVARNAFYGGGIGIYPFAWMCGYGENFEAELAEYSRRALQGRTVVVMNVERDAYFHGVSAWDRSSVKDVNSTRVCQATLRMNRILLHDRAHHAAPANRLINRDIALVEGGAFQMHNGETFPQALAKTIFSRN